MSGQTIIQVGPEFPIIDHLFEVFIRGSDDSNLHRHRFAISDPNDFSFLEDPKQSGLEPQRQFRDLIEKERASIRFLKVPPAPRCRSAKRSFLMTKKLAFHETFGNAATIHRHKGFAFSIPVPMKCPGNPLLAGTGFTLDDDGQIGLGENIPDIPKNFSKHRVSGDQRFRLSVFQGLQYARRLFHRNRVEKARPKSPWQTIVFFSFFYWLKICEIGMLERVIGKPLAKRGNIGKLSKSYWKTIGKAADYWQTVGNPTDQEGAMKNNTTMLISTFILAVFFSVALASDQPATPSDLIATVTKVVDGDTIHVRIKSTGIKEKVRIIGLDTPELHHPRKPVQYFAKEAKVQAEKLLKDKTITLRLDQVNVAKGHRDRYGRLLAHVILPDGTYFAERMIRDGFAHAYVKYPFDQQLMERYRRAEREAREAKRGLWK